MAKKFRYRGEVYETIKGATLGELRVAERHLQVNFDQFTTMDSAVVGFYVSIRRGQLAAGRTPLVTMDEVMECTLEDFEDVPDTAEPLPPAEPELPESEWPLDPKGGATLTDPPAGSGPSQRPEWAQESGSTTPDTSISGTSPSISAGLPHE
jgi:hypothetical protein